MQSTYQLYGIYATLYQGFYNKMFQIIYVVLENLLALHILFKKQFGI